MSAEYGADQIQILEGLEAVRKRPGMYIGSTSIRGLHHLVYEIVDNSVDEALAGVCDTISITLNKDGSATFVDNGRGIPVGINQKAGLPAGAICNPGAAAIEAALNPDSTQYYFFAHDNNKKIYMATTLEEHNANRRAIEKVNSHED